MKDDPLDGPGGAWCEVDPEQVAAIERRARRQILEAMGERRTPHQTEQLALLNAQAEVDNLRLLISGVVVFLTVKYGSRWKSDHVWSVCPVCHATIGDTDHDPDSPCPWPELVAEAAKA